MTISDIERQFLLSIIENLDEVANFLIYADWLEENNEKGLADQIRSCFGNINGFCRKSLFECKSLLAKQGDYTLIKGLYASFYKEKRLYFSYFRKSFHQWNGRWHKVDLQSIDSCLLKLFFFDHLVGIYYEQRSN